MFGARPSSDTHGFASLVAKTLVPSLEDAMLFHLARIPGFVKLNALKAACVGENAARTRAS
ncbi:hypothetical protein N9L76_01320 [bacterium]|jgi:hypothetical protein|nr:hypothetical protein [bacterium]